MIRNIFLHFWRWTDQQYNSKYSEAKRFCSKFSYLIASKTQLKKTKTLLIISLILAIWASLSITFTFGVSTHNLQITTRLISKILSMDIQHVIRFSLALIGFLGATFLVLRLKIGIVFLAVWASFQIIPVYFSQSSPSDMYDIFNATNSQVLVAGYMSGGVPSGENETDLFHGVTTIVTYRHMANSYGINVCGILALMLLIPILYQNRGVLKIYMYILLTIMIIICSAIPYVAHYSIDRHIRSMVSEIKVRKKIPSSGLHGSKTLSGSGILDRINNSISKDSNGIIDTIVSYDKLGSILVVRLGKINEDTKSRLVTRLEWKENKFIGEGHDEISYAK